METEPRIYCSCAMPQKQEYGQNCTQCNKIMRGVGDEPIVPQELIELFRQVVTLCKSAGCGSLQLTVNPGWESGFHGQVKAEWHTGRHGVPASMMITTELNSRIEV